jgi:hypothetical protein
MMTSETRKEVLRLYVALEFGEQLAHKCALQQASWVTNKKMQRFLHTQAKQEFAHARFFSMAANRIQIKHQYAPPDSLKQFASRLEQSISKKNLVETMVGSQIVLESFGEQILLRLNKGLDKSGTGFKKIRHTLLRQEQSHSAFGMHTLNTLIQNDEVSVNQVGELTGEYLLYINKITDEMSEVFHVLGEDPKGYTSDIVNNLPVWLRESLS